MTVPARIMLVEDSDDLRCMLVTLLQQSPRRYEVTACATGGDAVKTFVENFRCFPQAGILMDLVLPDVSGLSVLRAMRALEAGSLACSPARFGILSANTETIAGTGIEGDLNITMKLQKPFDAENFLATVEAWLAAPAPQLSPARQAAAAFVVSNGCG